MKRLQLFEFGDQDWCPRIIRRGITEFLATIARVSKLYAPTADVLNDLLKNSAAKNIVALASGSGGGILDILPNLHAETKVILTDIFPDQNFQSLDSRVVYFKESVDATAVPNDLKGIRVMYGAFHHFPPEAGKRVLENAVKDNQPIAIFESTERSPRGIVNPFFAPLAVLILTPLTRPFSLGRLLLTYAIPILPLVLFWDGLVSTLRTYTPDELKELTSEFPQYDWKTLTLKGPHQEHIPTLIGTPKK